jgi:hypothetical protein
LAVFGFSFYGMLELFQFLITLFDENVLDKVTELFDISKYEFSLFTCNFLCSIGKAEQSCFSLFFHLDLTFLELIINLLTECLPFNDIHKNLHNFPFTFYPISAHPTIDFSFWIANIFELFYYFENVVNIFFPISLTGNFK